MLYKEKYNYLSVKVEKLKYLQSYKIPNENDKENVSRKLAGIYFTI